MRTLRICLLTLIAALSTSIAFGQGVATGDLHVTVKDPTGTAVASASVTVRDDAKGIERPAAGNGQGEYSALALPPGSYTVSVDAKGFAKAK